MQYLVVMNLEFLIADHIKQDITLGGRLARMVSSRKDRIDPPMNRDDCYAATHSSEHNSVFIIGRSEYGRTRQQQQREKERRKLGLGHEFPFSSPIPGQNDYGYGCPHAQQVYLLACAVVCLPQVTLTRC